MRFDLLIKGGDVVDPGASLQGRMDVAIVRDRVAAVDREIPADAAFRVIDASGLLVTPGLIDLHTHVYAGATYWGVKPDPVAARSGATAVADAGSVGAMTFPAFRDWIVAPSRSRVFSFLNISYIGLAPDTHELAVLKWSDVDLCVRTANANRDVVRGIKVRMGHTVEPHGLEPMRRALQAAEQTELPLMTHIGYGPPDVAEVLDLMRPGDLLTHCFTGATMKIVDEQHRPLDATRRALERGMLLDVGHGGGGFAFATAAGMIAAGYPPDVISTDIHQDSIRGPMFDLPTTLGKFLVLGMSLPDVIERATARPAKVLGVEGELGTLRPGAYADVALFRLEDGTFPYYDTRKERRDGTQRLRHVLTVIGGQEVAPLPEEPPAPWMTVTEFQQELARQGLP